MKKIHWSSIPYYLLILLAFAFPFGKNATSILVIIFVLATAFQVILEIRSKGRLVVTTSHFALLLLSLPVIYFLWTIVGMLYTENVQQGFTELNKRISFVFLPVAFYFIRPTLTPIQLNYILKAFLLGTCCCAGISLLFGFYNSVSIEGGQLIFRTAVNDISYERGDSFFEQQTQGGNFFFGSYISPFIKNIIYYAIYLSFAILTAFWLDRSTITRLQAVVFSIVLFVVLFLCDSRGPIVSFLPAFFIAGILVFNKKKGFRILFPIILIAIIVMAATSPRISLLIKDFNTIRSTINYNSTESTALRFIVWEASAEIIREHWLLGVGTGDAGDAILQKTKNTNEKAYALKLNSHNQYLQVFIASGVIGFVLLLAMLITPFYFAVKYREVLFVSFLLVIGSNMLFESILQVFQGIQFFIFFYSLLVLKLTRSYESAAAV